MQGGTISLLVPTLAVLNLPEWQCPEPEVIEKMSFENRTELWQSRMRILSGAISLAAIVQVAIGAFGKLQHLLRYVTMSNDPSVFTMFSCPVSVTDNKICILISCTSSK